MSKEDINADHRTLKEWLTEDIKKIYVTFRLDKPKSEWDIIEIKTEHLGWSEDGETAMIRFHWMQPYDDTFTMDDYGKLWALSKVELMAVYDFLPKKGNEHIKLTADEVEYMTSEIETSLFNMRSSIRATCQTCHVQHEEDEAELCGDCCLPYFESQWQIGIEALEPIAKNIVFDLREIISNIIEARIDSVEGYSDEL